MNSSIPGTRDAPAPAPMQPSFTTETQRRRREMIGWSLWLLLAWLALGITGYAAMQDDPGGMIFFRTLLIALTCGVTAVLLLDRMLFMPSRDWAYILPLCVAIPFVSLLVAFALLHLAYSRVAFGGGMIATGAWLGLGYYRRVRGKHVRYGVIDPDVGDALASRIRSDGEFESIPEFVTIWGLDDARSVDGLVIDRRAATADSRARLITELNLRGLPVWSIGRVFELITGRVSLEFVEDAFLDSAGDRILYPVAKRGVDLLLVLATAPVWVPAMLLIALAIKLDSPGPALFFQERYGLNGRVFRMVKFRTMSHDQADRSGSLTASADPRITRVGHLLRRFRMDELPQLLNVIAGHMSLVGPRPEWVASGRGHYELIPHYHYRHLVRPGLSGWAQVMQGHVTDIAQTRIKLEYDLYYVKHMSFALDMVILAKTVRTVLSGFGAR